MEAGKHVFVEKPLALTLDEMARVEAALAAAGAGRPLLMVGFNRRFSPAAEAVREFFADVRRAAHGQRPVQRRALSMRSTGRRTRRSAAAASSARPATPSTSLPTSCDSPPVRVFAESVGGGEAPAVTDDQCFITLRHADGSVSSVAYLAGGDRAFSKERVEVFGGGRVAVIDDFREVTTVIGGAPEGASGRGRTKATGRRSTAFAEAVVGEAPEPIPWQQLRAVSLAAILAVRSLREGQPFDIP